MNIVTSLASAHFDGVAGTYGRSQEPVGPDLFGELLDTVVLPADEPAESPRESAHRDVRDEDSDDAATEEEASARDDADAAPAADRSSRNAAAGDTPLGDAIVARSTARGGKPAAGSALSRDHDVATPAASAATKAARAKAGTTADPALSGDAAAAHPAAVEARSAATRPSVRLRPSATLLDGAIATELENVNARRAGVRTAADRKFTVGEVAFERLADRKSVQQTTGRATADAHPAKTGTSAERTADLFDRLAQRLAAGTPPPAAAASFLPAQANATASPGLPFRGTEPTLPLPSGTGDFDVAQAAPHAAGRANAAAGTAAQIAARPPQMPAGTPAEQVSVRIQHGLRNDSDRISVRLHPAALGKVEVKLEVTPDRAVTAIVTAERPETLDMLARDARILQRALEEAGLHTDSNSLSFHHNDGNRGAAQQFAERPAAARAEMVGDPAAQSADAGAPDSEPRNRRATHDGLLDVEV
jgi:flagellar hook-length control protein FliK